MAILHSVTVSDGASDCTLSWSPDGAFITTQGEEGGPVRIEIDREGLFALSQFCGTALNQVHFNEDQSPDDD